MKIKPKTSPVNYKRVASSVKASMEFEGLKPSAYAIKMGDSYLEGKISGKDAREKIRAKHSSKFGQKNW